MKKIMILVSLSFALLQSKPLDMLKFMLIINSKQTVVLERFGRYIKTLHGGLHFKIPFVDVPRQVHWSYNDPKGNRYILPISRIDTRETVYNFPRQQVITKDNVVMSITALVYYRINNPEAAVYGVEDLPLAIESITQTTLRNVIGAMHLDETLVSRDNINALLKNTLGDASKQWGAEVTRVELQEVTPPKDICDSMARQMLAERNSRAWVLEADGQKKALVLEAEGKRDAAILNAVGEKEAALRKAEGEAEARIKKSQAEAEAIELIRRASGGDALPYLLGAQYLNTLKELSAGNKSKLVIVPYDTASIAGSISMIKKVFEEAGEDSKDSTEDSVAKIIKSKINGKK